MSDYRDNSFNKRQFITGAAAAGLGLGFGLPAWAQGFQPNPQQMIQAAKSGQYAVDPNTMFDVIVIGSGTAGMPLAIEAAKRGKVLVIDKAPRLGGTLHLSGGMMSAGGTNLQKRKGIEDSAQHLYDDTMKMSHGKANPEVLRVYVDNGADTINWLEDLGLVYPPEQPGLGVHAEFKTRRYHGGKDGGRSLMAIFLPLFQKAESEGKIRVVLNSGAVELPKDKNGAVTGVIVEDANGKRTQYKGRNVVITAGGTIHGAQNFERYHGKKLWVQSGYDFSMGQGIVLGENAGAHVSGKDYFIGHPGSIIQGKSNGPSPLAGRASLDPRRRKPWEILVNKSGDRFVQEDTPDIDLYERKLTDAEDMAGWVVFDQQIFDKAPQLVSGPKADLIAKFDAGHPSFARAATLEEAARKMGLPPERVAASVAGFNKSQAAGGAGDPFGRTHSPLPIGTGPFYIIETYTSGVFTFAGLDINNKLQVIDANKKPIPNLYAAGEVTGGWQCAGDVVVNGCMVTPAITFGRLLGQRMLTI